MSMFKTLHALGEILDLDCGDNSCVFGKQPKTGMRTNGGCRCDAVQAVKAIRDERDRLRIAITEAHDRFGYPSTKNLRDAERILDDARSKFEAEDDEP